MPLTRSVCLAVFTFASIAPAANSLDPLAVDPKHYHIEIENQWVRVFRERLEPHGTLIQHTHPAPGSTVVYLTNQNIRQTLGDGTIRMLNHKAGDVAWWPPSTHTSLNLSDEPFECIQIEPRPAAGFKPAPAEPMDAVTVDPQHYKVEVDNEFVRAIRLSIAPHEKLMMHKHPDTWAVIVHLTDQDMRQFHAGGEARESHYKAGQVRWVPADTAHQDENLGSGSMRLIRVEVKQAR
jgi:quercetin dioxygenase-like cupin family protein